MYETMSVREMEKKKAADQAKAEQELDIKNNIDMIKSYDRREVERNNFFENKRRIPNENTKKLLENAMKEFENNKKIEQEKIRLMELESIRREKTDDEMRKSKYKSGQKYMKEYYDMQVEAKKKNKDYEQYIDNFQVRIWNEDRKLQTEQEKEDSEKVYSYVIVILD